MAAATKKQIQCIYVIAAKCGLVERGNKEDNLHNLVYQLTEKESISDLTEELAALSPSEAKVKDRLCGIIFKELGIKVNPKGDIFKGFSERQGAKLIDALKRYVMSAKRKGGGNGYKQAQG